MVKKWLKVDKFESRIKIMLMYRSFFKPLIGITLSILGLAVCGLPMLIIAIAIKMDSPGPVLFRQERLGKGMKEFRICKFRTMCNHAFEKGGVATSASDSRITRVGAVLRRTSLDELPQMFNVIIGQMAIIGPRPILDFEFEPYKDDARFLKRYDVAPGMFCTIDVYDRAAERDLQMEFDADYVEQQSLWLGVKIFFGIIKLVLTGDGVHKDESKYKKNNE